MTTRKISSYPNLMEVESQDELMGIYNSNTRQLNTQLRNLTISHSLASSVKTITILAGQTATISHSLKNIPIGKLILKIKGTTLIEDGEYTDKYIKLINKGSSDCVLTIAILSN